MLKSLRSISLIWNVNNKLLANFAKETISYDYLYGVNVVQAAVYAQKRILQTLYISDSDYVEIQSPISKLIIYSKNSGLNVIFTEKIKLNAMVKGQPHQNVVLKCSPLPIKKWNINDRFSNGNYIFCDHITDPQNMGAILRSAHYFALDGIFTRKKNSCPINETVAKTSAGAIQFLNIIHVEKDQDFLKKWKEIGGTILVTSMDESKNLKTMDQLKKVFFDQRLTKILIIFGSQGAGVSPHLQKYADFYVTIIGFGNKKYPQNLVDSLNVNAAASIILYEMTKQTKF